MEVLIACEKQTNSCADETSKMLRKKTDKFRNHFVAIISVTQTVYATIIIEKHHDSLKKLIGSLFHWQVLEVEHQRKAQVRQRLLTSVGE